MVAQTFEALERPVRMFSMLACKHFVLESLSGMLVEVQWAHGHLQSQTPWEAPGNLQWAHATVFFSLHRPKAESAMIYL